MFPIEVLKLAIEANIICQGDDCAEHGSCDETCGVHVGSPTKPI